mmetsp:Transcript_876/g.3037  ORF Transcript_876/g.3037 Transcript_876/m.3037 type:complete len:150 (+) Transcript_876:378-827(+)
MCRSSERGSDSMVMLQGAVNQVVALKLQHVVRLNVFVELDHLAQTLVELCGGHASGQKCLNPSTSGFFISFHSNQTKVTADDRALEKKLSFLRFVLLLDLVVILETHCLVRFWNQSSSKSAHGLLFHQQPAAISHNKPKIVAPSLNILE